MSTRTVSFFFSSPSPSTLTGRGGGLDDALGHERVAIDDIAVGEDLVEARHVDDRVLDAVAVLESGELGQTHRERRLAALEAGTLGAAGARALALVASTGGAAVAATVAAPDTLAGLAGTGCGEQVVDLHVRTPFRSLDGGAVVRVLRCRPLAAG